MYKVTIVFNDLWFDGGRMVKFTTECADHAAFIIENARPMVKAFYVMVNGKRIAEWYNYLADLQRQGGGNFGYITEVKRLVRRAQV